MGSPAKDEGYPLRTSPGFTKKRGVIKRVGNPRSPHPFPGEFDADQTTSNNPKPTPGRASFAINPGDPQSQGANPHPSISSEGKT